MPDTCDTISVVHSLKQQIGALTQQQWEALERATYLGMSTHEAKEYDKRRGHIARLFQELAAVEKGL